MAAELSQEAFYTQENTNIAEPLKNGPIPKRKVYTVIFEAPFFRGM